MPAAGILALLLSGPTHVDLGAMVLAEVWDFNEGTEVLTGAVAGVDHRVWRGIAVRAEVMALRVWQDRDSAWLGGFTVGTRVRLNNQRTRPFIDVAVGLSNATAPVPPTGTEFNYLAAIGAGVEHQVGAVRVVVTGRWLHASNNGRAGRHRNPDIQSLGAVLSVGWEH
jgi:hypothetical protein